MAKVFTITEGLENLGAMKTGGQGSVYKGRRIGEIFTAIKILPTPIFSESPEDKNFSDFQNEVQKLKKVNEEPNPHVVTIVNSGVTESGNLPFIEMEYIEGPDLEELLKPPHHPIFTIKEIIKVAEQLSNALAHCHKFDVKHGDIKSNNVKFNVRTGNYILLDFGLSIMSDEQRRTSLRHAGAIEFMAPEQNEGQMLFQTDVYSFGIILYELLAGVVPFPLHDKGERARNAVRLAHIETLPPDMLDLRNKTLPEQWNDHKKEREMHVPAWLIGMINKCIHKDPSDRFENGIELHEYIVLNSTVSASKEAPDTKQSILLKKQSENLLKENNHLQTEVMDLKNQVESLNKEIVLLNALRYDNSPGIQTLPDTQTVYEDQTRGMVSQRSFILLLMLTIGLGVFAAYKILYKPVPVKQRQTQNVPDSSLLVKNDTADKLLNEPVKEKKDSDDTNIIHPEIIPNIPGAEKNAEEDSVDNYDDDYQQTDNSNASWYARYKVISKAFFHDRPDESTKRNAFIIQLDNAILDPLADKNGFIFIVFTNHLGQTSKGWLRKKDLVKLE